MNTSQMIVEVLRSSEMTPYNGDSMKVLDAKHMFISPPPYDHHVLWSSASGQSWYYSQAH